MTDVPSSSPGSLQDDRYYRTRSFYLAAYLFAYGLWLVNVYEAARGEGVFVFEDTAQRETLVDEFLYGPKPTVDARKFAAAVRELRHQAAELGFDPEP